MTPNLTAYYWAEQAHRQRLASHAARAWLAEEAVASRPAADRTAQLRRAAGRWLVRAGACLQGIPVAGPVPPIAAPGRTPS